MEAFSISFSAEDVSLMNGSNYFVPDVLLIKAWYVSTYCKENIHRHHLKQTVTCNHLITETKYDVEIVLLDERTIKQTKHYTYETSYYLNGKLKANVLSTYLEEVPHAVSNFSR
ncbi:hypothetical protein [Macrococcoides caseolyticum]|uniref:hypothetical protein n=1 Tax=Macrococcoides caseolyticum TaxID=69966 RepID=UPI001F4125B4|nr:hypothetical protein [Macrococcus caseolyticus]MCE4956504.1 hypothetical protein [Macrococcus caseolyticus]